jgi:hypothetical protein
MKDLHMRPTWLLVRSSKVSAMTMPVNNLQDLPSVHCSLRKAHLKAVGVNRQRQMSRKALPSMYSLHSRRSRLRSPSLQCSNNRNLLGTTKSLHSTHRWQAGRRIRHCSSGHHRTHLRCKHGVTSPWHNSPVQILGTRSVDGMATVPVSRSICMQWLIFRQIPKGLCVNHGLTSIVSTMKIFDAQSVSESGQ